MSLLKYVIIGAAVAYGINEITKVREDGTTILDDLTKDAPEWMDKAKQFATDALDNFKDTLHQQTDNQGFDKTV